MTVAKLHRILAKLIAQGHGRRRVCVRKNSFQHNCESDGVVILDVEAANLVGHQIDDGDGCAKLRADGTQIERESLVLTGGAADARGRMEGDEP